MQLLKEAILATLLVLLIVYGISFLPIKAEVAKPIKQEFGDFDIYDLHYSGKYKSQASRDSDVVIVQIGDTRDEIASQIRLLSAHHPAVIGLDAIFPDSKTPEEDSALLQAVALTPRLVLSSRISKDSAKDELKIASSYFGTDSSLPERTGYFNLVGEELTVARYYSPFAEINDQKEFAFTSRIVERFSPLKLANLLKRGRYQEIINYRGNLESFNNFTKEELVYYDKTGQLADKLRGKIVLIGFFKRNPPYLLEDLHYTPLNDRITGKSYPDMYGIVIHANILSMIIRDDFALQPGLWLSYLIAFFVSVFLIAYVLKQHRKHEHPSHFLIHIIQFVLTLAIIYVFLLLFNYFDVKILMLPVIMAVVLSVQVLGLYKLIARWLSRKTGYKTIFEIKHERK